MPCPTPRPCPPWRWLGLLLAGAAQAVPVATLGEPPAPADLAAQVLRVVNHYRAGQALAAWEPDTQLSAIASAHSQQMALRSQVSHDGFDTRFAHTRRRHCVENLAAGFGRAEPLVAAWLASASHRDNLLATRPRQVGLGLVDGYLTLMACEPATSANPGPAAPSAAPASPP